MANLDYTKNMIIIWWKGTGVFHQILTKNPRPFSLKFNEWGQALKS
jgi:hypothetical protein